MSSPSISSNVLEMVVSGRNLRPGMLRDQLGAGPTLLVFLRHLGCPFCREWLDELRKAGENDRTFPPRLYFHLGTVEQGDAFFSAYTPEARAVADPKRFFYKALGVPQASPVQLFDPRVWACGIRAHRKGFKGGKIVGDPFTMPALFLIEANQITWKSIPDHMGSLPRLGDIPRPVVA